MIVHAVFAPEGRKILRTACGRGKTDNLAAVADNDGAARKRITCRNCHGTIEARPNRSRAGAWAMEGFHFSSAAPKQLPPGNYDAQVKVEHHADGRAEILHRTTDGTLVREPLRDSDRRTAHQDEKQQEIDAHRWRKVARMLAALYAQGVPIDQVVENQDAAWWCQVAQAAGVNDPSYTTIDLLQEIVTEAQRIAVQAGASAAPARGSKKPRATAQVRGRRKPKKGA